MLALSPQRELNALAAHRYRREFGDNNMYTLIASTEKGEEKHSNAPPAGHIAFGKDVSYARLAELLSDGAEIRETKLSETFDFDAYYKKYYKRAIPLFAIDAKKHLRVFRGGEDLKPGPGWVLLSLIEKETAPKLEPQKTESSAVSKAVE